MLRKEFAARRPAHVPDAPTHAALVAARRARADEIQSDAAQPDGVQAHEAQADEVQADEQRQEVRS
ncbi:Uncharacterised protein [Mycobacteroides abscessus subsp. abscessus]|nr:Uncharacterised protein [Mycobacteroides abscessus subsp. abscessus]